MHNVFSLPNLRLLLDGVAVFMLSANTRCSVADIQGLAYKPELGKGH
jgi:hypothetical protein